MIVVLKLFALLLVTVYTTSALRPRIIDGENVEPGQFPFMASIQWGIIWYKHSCGGVIIDKFWVVTAAHCWTKKPKIGRFRIKVGAVNILKDTEYVQIAKIAKAIVHELYNEKFGLYDIALLKLTSPLSLNDWVKEALLSESPVNDTVQVAIAGWGSTSKSRLLLFPEILKGAIVPIISNEACEATFNVHVPPTKIYESQFCTGCYSDSEYTSTCIGDSGGPVTQIRNRRLEVIGIISWTLTPCGIYKTPSVHTQISHVINWIREKITEK